MKNWSKLIIGQIMWFSDLQWCHHFDPLWIIEGDTPRILIHLRNLSITHRDKALTFDQKWIKGCFSIRKVNQKIDPLFRKPKKDFEPSGKTEITFEGVELIRNDEIFRDQGQGSADIINCLLTFTVGRLGPVGSWNPDKDATQPYKFNFPTSIFESACYKYTVLLMNTQECVFLYTRVRESEGLLR